MMVIVPGRMTLAELDALPNDGARYELHDGEVLVTPAPSGPHNDMVSRIWAVLDRAAPDTYRVQEGYQLHPPGERRFIPDVSVLVASHYRQLEAVDPPDLVVEVLSPSAAGIDLTHKLRAYAEFGIGHYWLAEPMTPALVVLSLDDGGRYRLAAEAVGDQRLALSLPFAVEVVPTELRRHQPVDAALEARLDLPAAVRAGLHR